MITVDFKVESRYRIDRERVKKTIIASLAAHGVCDDFEVSVVVCGERRIRELHKHYLAQVGDLPEDELHDVLSFPLEGEKSPEGTLLLGDIVLCYPQVLKAAAEHNRMVDEEIDFLVDHACLHLLGIHHEE